MNDRIACAKVVFLAGYLDTLLYDRKAALSKRSRLQKYLGEKN